MSSFSLCIIATIFLNLLIVITNEIECNTAYRECFNCSICGEETTCNCHWDPTLKQCDPGDNISLSDPFYNYFTSCTDSNSVVITKKYCGKTTLEFDEDDEINIIMPNNNGIFGTNTLFCEYTYTESEEKNNYYVIKYNDEDERNIDKIYIYLYLSFKDETITEGYLSRKSIKKEFDNVKEIKVFIYFSQGLSSLPFKLTIIRIGDKAKIALYLAIGFIILACLLCALIIYYLSKKISHNTRMRQRALIQIAMERQRGRPQSGDDLAFSNSPDIEEENRKKIEILLKTSLAAKKYTKVSGEKEASTCTICIEKFKEKKSKVSITPCKHIFHYKCLSNWLIKNVINPKCPNCNYNLVKDFDNQKIEEIQTINVARRDNENNEGGEINIREVNENLNTNDYLVTRNMSNRHRNNRISLGPFNPSTIESRENNNVIQEVDIQNN